MNVLAVVLSWNPTRTGRYGLLERTCETLADADRVIVVDNGSTDGTDFGRWTSWRNETANTTSGYGTWCGLRIGAGSGADLVVVSDDDMVWHDGWRGRLEAFWQAAPDDVLLAGGHLEPAFFWNEIVAVHDGWVERASTGAASWTTTRPQQVAEYGAALRLDQQGVWDVPVCQKVREAGWRIGQLDLAEHVGETSTWGNGTVEQYGWAVEPIRDLIR